MQHVALELSDGDFMNSRCPKCNSENVYQDRNLWVCVDCAHEWMQNAPASAAPPEAETDIDIRDANDNVLADGDTVVVIKDLKIKGSSSAVKVGTKVKNIRLVDAGDGHNIA